MESQGLQPKRIVLEEAFPPSELSGLADFIEKHFLAINVPFFENEKYEEQTIGEGVEFSWVVKIARHHGIEPIDYTLLPVKLSLDPSGIVVEYLNLDVSEKAAFNLCSRITAELQNITWDYLHHLRMTSFYFILGGNPKGTSKQKNVFLRTIFAGNGLNLFLLMMLLSFPFFFVLGLYTPIVLVALQFPLVIFSDRLMLQSGDVKPNEEDPAVTVVSVRASEKMIKSLGKYTKSVLENARREIKSDNLAQPYLNYPANAKSRICKIMNKNSVPCTENDIEIRTRNIMKIVSDAAARFQMKPPKIVMIETPVSNAAATGISRNRSSIMITAGSLEDLNDDELEAVIGHEFGHVKGRDPLILFGVTSFEFLGRFYLWLPLLLYFGFLYLIFAFGLIFFIGKFLETRADTFSANEIGTPSVLASSLIKIGYRQLFSERCSSRVRIFDWLKFDPHPPIYFRVKRLSKMKGFEKVRHPFYNSVKDCTIGFVSALFGR